MKAIRISNEAHSILKKMSDQSGRKMISMLDLILKAYQEGMGDEETAERVDTKSLQAGKKR
jgi:predicted DNA-binding protein